MADAPMTVKPPDSHVNVLDSLLDAEVVADARLVISHRWRDLIIVGLRALLASMDTAGRMTFRDRAP